MAAIYNLKQGEDLIVEIPVYENNVAVDLSTATDVIVTLTNARVAQYKYSLVAMTGYGALTIKAGVGNEHIIEVQVKRAESKDFSIGYVQVNALVELPDLLLINKRTEYNYPGYLYVGEGYTKTEIVD